jgi:hypothetical protein
VAWPNAPVPSLSAQLLRLHALGLPNAAGAIADHGRNLRFDFEATPYVGGRDYRCRLQVDREALTADAFVLNPNLQALAPDRSLPHIYGTENGHTKICVYWPKGGEWRRGLMLAATMVPWTIEWLRYFELWLSEGIWYGGGMHPDATSRRRYGIRGKGR